MRRSQPRSSRTVLATTVLACFATSALFSGSTAWASTYRWVDANGVVNYSERKPRNVPEEAITQIGSESSTPARATADTPTPNAAPSSSTTETRDPNADLTDDQQRMLSRLQEAEQERQQAVAQIRQDNCAKSRKALSDLTAKDRVRINMPDGSQRVLGEDERQKFISQAQNGIVRNCDS